MAQGPKFIVWKVIKDEKDELTISLRPNRQYIVVNIDEPYAEKVYDVLKEGEKAKGTWKDDDPDTWEDFEAKCKEWG